MSAESNILLMLISFMLGLLTVIVTVASRVLVSSISRTNTALVRHVQQSDNTHGDIYSDISKHGERLARVETRSDGPGSGGG